MTTKKETADKLKREARARLLSLLKPGATVYYDVKQVSRSGMSRHIALYVPVREYESVYPLKPESEAEYTGARDYTAKPRRVFKGLGIRDITRDAARVVGYSVDDRTGGAKICGCGMNMGFHFIYSLGASLWPNGTPKPHGRRNGAPDSDGGYALKYSSL